MKVFFSANMDKINDNLSKLKRFYPDLDSKMPVPPKKNMHWLPIIVFLVGTGILGGVDYLVLSGLFDSSYFVLWCIITIVLTLILLIAFACFLLDQVDFQAAEKRYMEDLKLFQKKQIKIFYQYLAKTFYDDDNLDYIN